MKLRSARKWMNMRNRNRREIQKGMGCIWLQRLLDRLLRMLASFFEYARGEARGMMVKVRIAIYNICWSFRCYDLDILVVMDQAISEGVNVISLFIEANGRAPRYDHDSIVIGAFGVVKRSS
ncbi:hypothetical protein U1Q18_000884 [Sarracenia purpurea var. burkii]